MSNLAVKVAVIESEAGWGSKIDDWMICQSVEDAKKFETEFNSENNKPSTPSWYMRADGPPIPIDLNDSQFEKLKKEGRVWLSSLRDIK